jgi:hypothetical protein
VPGIKGKPSPVEKNLEPGAEIHRRRIFGYADVAEIARSVTRRNVHAATKRDGQMGEVAADPDALFVALRRRAVAACVVVAKLDTFMHVVADRLHALPTAGDRPEERPGEIGQLLGVAIATSVKERQHFVRQVVNIPLPSSGRRFIRQAAIFNQNIIADFDTASGRQKPGPGIANRIEAVASYDPWRYLKLMFTEKVFLA